METDDLVRRDAYRMTPDDAGELLTLQYAAWVLEAVENDTLALPTLHEHLDDVRAQLADPAFAIWGLRRAGRLIGTVRTTILADGAGYVGRLGVVPDLHGEGLGSALLRHAESTLDVRRIELITGVGSVSNHRFYARHGYAIVERPEGAGYVRLGKIIG